MAQADKDFDEELDSLLEGVYARCDSIDQLISACYLCRRPVGPHDEIIAG